MAWRWGRVFPTENYARHWCSRLTDPTGSFSRCHSVINPKPFHSVRGHEARSLPLGRMGWGALAGWGP